MVQLVQEIEVRKVSGRTEKNEVFQQIDGTVYCRECGSEWKDDGSEIETCNNCGSTRFLKGRLAASLAGYSRLYDSGNIRKCFDSRFKKGGARLNERRMILWMLIKDGLLIPGDRKSETMVYKILSRKRSD